MNETRTEYEIELEAKLLKARQDHSAAQLELETLKDHYNKIDRERSEAWGAKHTADKLLETLKQEYNTRVERLDAIAKELGLDPEKTMSWQLVSRIQELKGSFSARDSTIREIAELLGLNPAEASFNLIIDRTHYVTKKLEQLSARAAQGKGELTLRELQTKLPWTIHYHHDFRASPMAHKDFAHALIHVFKAAGKLASLVNDAEHGGCDFAASETDKYVADLVVCALRMANTCPGHTIDMQDAVVDRIETKNEVKLMSGS